ncbi:MAG: peroxidase-related enzyme [Rhodospirillaceae bacterium]
MSRIGMLSDAELGDLMDVIAPSRKVLGFIPNSQRIMAHKPELLRAFAQLVGAVYGPKNSVLPAELKSMISHVSSLTAGCMYCVAHTGSTTGRTGVEDDKIRAIWEFETSDLFTDAEKSALRFAQAASAVPNMVTDADFEDLRLHFSDVEIVEIVSVIALFGFLNRWNDTMATSLEEEPVEFAERALAGIGWKGGKHLVPDAG